MWNSALQEGVLVIFTSIANILFFGGDWSLGYNYVQS